VTEEDLGLRVFTWMVAGVPHSECKTRWRHSRLSLRSYHHGNTVAILEPEKPSSLGAGENPFEIAKARKL
jgi:hypothetical protein